MQFKHPELLWALFLLLIPILIHLFQLRRFKKTPFTNVKLLKKVVSESRKSSTLKKWLLLFSRLGLLAGLVIAFAQPFNASETALKEKENVFYLDNSFSLQTKTENGTLFQNTVQEFIKNIPEEQKFHLFTNDNVFLDVEIKDIQNDLLNLVPSTNQLSLQEVVLRANTYYTKSDETQKNTIIISDFQQRMGSLPNDSILNMNIYYINPVIDAIQNIAIDSIYLESSRNENMELTALITSNNAVETTAVSLYNGDKLIAKTAANFNQNNKASVNFSVPSNQQINGKIVISDTGLSYDNQFYFNIDTPEKIKVLDIGSSTSGFLNKIFTDPQFQYSKSNLNQLNYGALETYNLIVLNELPEIPTGLTMALHSFTGNGGSLVIIPASKIDVVSYNQLVSSYNQTAYSSKINQEIAISSIKFGHPLYANVFEKNISNFQYPTVSGYFEFKSTAPTVLELQNNSPFLVGTNNIYLFAASLEDSNFESSPLVVPTFFNMGANSLKSSELYSTIGIFTEIDIPLTLNKDDVLKVIDNDYEFIPQQRALPKKTRLSFEENPVKDGIYQILGGGEILRNVSFNYDRKESDLSYLDLEQLTTASINNSVTGFFEIIQKRNTINELWKWFAILALLFVLIETALQRFLK